MKGEKHGGRGRDCGRDCGVHVAVHRRPPRRSAAAATREAPSGGAVFGTGRVGTRCDSRDWGQATGAAGVL